MAAHVERFGHDVETRHAGDAAGRRQIAGQDAHGRRLAGAVQAEEADDFTFINSEGDMVDGQYRPEILGEVIDLDHHVAVSARVKKPLFIWGFYAPVGRLVQKTIDPGSKVPIMYNMVILYFWSEPWKSVSLRSATSLPML